MAIRPIVMYPHDVLATKASPVREVDAQVRQLVDDMIETMYDAPGVGLAAPQIGVLQRVAVIDVSARDEDGRLFVFINPEIIHREGKILWEEGCLSIPGIYEKVERSAKIAVRALDADGLPFEVEADELFAVAIQHEIDHLDGVVFLDHLSHMKRRMALKKYKKHLQRMQEDAAEEAKKVKESGV